MARVFTIEEANGLVPRLETLFDQLNRLRGDAGPIQSSISHVERYGYSNGVDQATKLRDLRSQLDAKMKEIKTAFEDITALGCEVKDIDVGLVDFPAERDGRIVYLCWRRGEDRIRYWHERDAGFAGRQPL